MKFNKTKAEVMCAIHSYFDETIKKEESLDWTKCIEYVSKETGLREVVILQAIVIDYSIMVYEEIEKTMKDSPDKKELQGVRKELKKRKA